MKSHNLTRRRDKYKARCLPVTCSLTALSSSARTCIFRLDDPWSRLDPRSIPVAAVASTRPKARPPSQPQHHRHRPWAPSNYSTDFNRPPTFAPDDRLALKSLIKPSQHPARQSIGFAMPLATYKLTSPVAVSASSTGLLVREKSARILV